MTRGQPPRYVGRIDNDDAGNITDNKSGHSSDSGSYTSASEEQEKAWRPRAWNSGSLLVRPGSDRPSGRVSRTTYIYLVGAPGRNNDIEVEVIVGGSGGGGKKQRTVLSKSSGTTCACIAAQETYTVRNLYSGDGKGKTAVLFWTSPSGDQVGFHLLWLGEPGFGGGRGGEGGRSRSAPLEHAWVL